jgi:hypothetical protein
MRRVASAVVIAAVGAVAIVAAVDAVERFAEPELPVPSLRLHFPDARTVLRGRLIWIDARCRLRVTDIATLRQLEKPHRVSCRAGLDSRGRLTRRVKRVETSRWGGLFIASSRDGLVTLTRDGKPIRLPIRRARALVWSPDERWALAAGRRSLFLFRPGDPELRFRRLPIAARDLAWVAGSA